MVKTAVIGASGFIGRHLWQAYRQTFPDCLGTCFAHPGPGLVPFDLRHPVAAALGLEEDGYGAVLIASARSNIAFCEEQPEEAYAVNVRGTLELVRQLGRTSLQVLFLSSDYVFPGTTGGYDDNSEPCPTTEYGRQKLLVEREIPSLTDNFLVLRLSKVYGLSKGDGTLLDEMACALASGREVKAAADQVFCPTWIGDLVRAVLAIQQRGLRGVMNLCGPEACSRFDLARSLAEAMGIDPGKVKRISLHDLPSMAGRPLNTSLRCSRLAQHPDISFLSPWEAVRRMAAVWRRP